ncbi:alkaline phosphatase D family protein [Candidatus Methylacidiphilum infernorum]|uniref:Phosphodiesterase/alkaline phosphatase D n=1 Tax=Methylacidiphilum infernorum (isolate V4) TaxID=481448 RepID=B3E010_METI4|nr:alkaline phosphatase D family protein [Candidatus Methylacidiphilum infernorum]ACD82671.1 Phosphodiesterase/alkaline phosphatase D [Methylacidiphilum infernorum V4]
MNSFIRLGSFVFFIFTLSFSLLGEKTEGNYFPYGLSSGDPTAGSVIIWSRIESSLPSVEVDYEVALDPEFKKIVKKGSLKTSPATDYTLKTDVQGLEPATTYYYRWSWNGHASPTGRTRTLPLQAKNFRIALASCQHYGAGFYNAYRFIAQDNPDCILHVGDWIYEFPVYGTFCARPDPVGTAVDLDSYRAKHRLYRTDPDLQEALKNIPLVALWDDHEVQNDYAGKALSFYNPDRMKAAYTAYFEYLPVREQKEWKLYRSLKVGNLFELFLTDGRQYRDEDIWHPAIHPSLEALLQATALGRSMLGTEQRKWLIDSLKSSNAPWKFIASGDMMMEIKREGKPLNLDQWDGFDWERKEILRSIRENKVKNVIVLSGDSHIFSFGKVLLEGEPLALEIGTAGISSPAGKIEGKEELLKQNPHVLFTDTDHRGYVLLDIGPEGMDIFFYGMTTVLSREAQRVLLKKIHIPRSL